MMVNEMITTSGRCIGIDMKHHDMKRIEGKLVWVNNMFKDVVTKVGTNAMMYIDSEVVVGDKNTWVAPVIPINKLIYSGSNHMVLTSLQNIRLYVEHNGAFGAHKRKYPNAFDWFVAGSHVVVCERVGSRYYTIHENIYIGA